MRTFIMTESGRMEAEPGRYDDCVMALALANHGHKGMAGSVKMTDSWYAEAL
jgi:hypothetical protein